MFLSQILYHSLSNSLAVLISRGPFGFESDVKKWFGLFFPENILNVYL